MAYSITWDKKTVYCKFSDEVSGQELVECNMTMYGNPNFDNIRLQVIDMLDATKITFSPDDVKEVAPDVLRHRILCSFEAEARGIDSDEIVRVLLNNITVP